MLHNATGYLHDAIFTRDDQYITAGGSSRQTVTKTYTPTESVQTETITPDSGYDGIGEVDVTVGAISSSYVGSGVTQRASSDLTASGATVTAPAGYYETAATKTIASGTAGTPTVTKGTVSNHAVSITPSVTNTSGYITGSTKTGTAVSVSASELASGNLAITENGTGIDVTNYATVSVAVESSGGASTVATASATPSSNSTSISFSVEGEPIMFAVQWSYTSGSYMSGSSTRYITSVICDGTNAYGSSVYRSSSSGREYFYSTVTFSYSSGTLTVTSPGSSTLGYFRSGYEYRLIYVY